MSISLTSRAIPRTPLHKLVLCFVLCCNTTPILAADQPLSLNEAQRLAVSRSHQLAGQDNAIIAAHEMAVSARQLPDPVLKFGIDNLPVAGADRYSLGNDFMTMRRIGVMQEITRADKLKYRADQFEISAQKTSAEKSLSMASIQRDTAMAWLERHYVEKLIALINEQLKQTQLENQAAQSAYKSGRTSQADVFAAESAVAMIEDRQIELLARLSNAKTQLFRWTGNASETPLAEPPDLTKLADLPLDNAELSKQLTRHPQLGILAKQEQMANTEASLARANQKPDWSVELSYQQRGSAYPNMLSIGVSLPLQWDQAKRQNRELSAKLAMAAQAGSEHQESLRIIVAEVKNMVTEWVSKRERLARFQSKLLPLAQQRSTANLAAYRGGKLSLSELLASQGSEIETRMQNIQLEADAAKLWAALQFFTATSEFDVAQKESK